MKSSLLSVSLTLLGAIAPAQIAAPIMPSGQPLLPMVPIVLGAVAPPVVWAFGNPGFAIASLAAAPIPAGLPTLLVIGPAVMPPIVVPPPLAMPGFGAALLTNMAPIVIPTGLSGPLPPPPGPLPIPPTGGPLGVTLTAHTLVVALPSLYLTAAVGITL